MSEPVRVTDCAGLGWLALWTFLIWFTLMGINTHLRSIAKSQRQIVAVYPVIETDPNTINIRFITEEKNEDTEISS